MPAFNCCRRRKIYVANDRKVKATDPENNQQYQYANNYIRTTKYNVFTFLPKNLFEQFQRIANAYFLILLIMQTIPAISSLPWYNTFLPLVFVLGITAVKDAVDDIRRYRSDRKVNYRWSKVLRGGVLVRERWCNIVVGDIIQVADNGPVPADLLLLATSENQGLCYIETAELDGETNLKVRRAIPETSSDSDVRNGVKFDAEITCQVPNHKLSEFVGVMRWKGRKLILDNDEMLLRGYVLRNTKWCYGLVIYAGHDTKVMMNSGKSIFKRTHIDRLLNYIVVGILIFLLLLCLLMTIGCGVWETNSGQYFQAYLPWESFVPGSPSMDGTVTEGATAISVLVFFSYIIIFNTVVPISLYVSVEIFRMANSLWINWDLKMYDGKTDTPAQARTTALIEDLGQIEYIFTDKTGTLTQNKMTFKNCLVGRKSYGDIKDKNGKVVKVNELTPKVIFSQNPYFESSFEFYDQTLLTAVEDGNTQVYSFFHILALCHTVMADDTDGKLEYHTLSPDEKVLVGAARNFGFVFKSRTAQTITIVVKGQDEVYKLLCILEFTYERKRMSVIVEKDGKIMLLCKGADSVIYERLRPDCDEDKSQCTEYLTRVAADGHRTLCLAQKEISPKDWKDWKQKYDQTRMIFEDRNAKLTAVYDEIENDLTLVGATAVEDKLQDGVPDAIANLAKAGIKIWVLTGDKPETTINIGNACKLLTYESNSIFELKGESSDDVKLQIFKALETINPESNTYELVIHGKSLVHALNPDLKQPFLDLCCLCKTVVCCRLTPLQKSMVVDLIKTNTKSVTLAIGDGDNDVSMLKTADVGVGISGQEGLQAVLASDYSISQFRYLERLLLVHGQWSYFRMSKFLRYFFYKNFTFTLCHLWFAFYCGFSAQTLFDPYFISFYNLFYTALPCLVLAAFDQDVTDSVSLRYPELYTRGLTDELFNKKVFLSGAAEGFMTSYVLFAIPYGVYHVEIDHQSFGVVVASILVVAVNLRCALDTSYWTGFNHFVTWGSIIFYFCLTLAMYSTIWNYEYMGTGVKVYSTATFWFCLVLTNVILLVPVIAYRICYVIAYRICYQDIKISMRAAYKLNMTAQTVQERAQLARKNMHTRTQSARKIMHKRAQVVVTELIKGAQVAVNDLNRRAQIAVKEV